MIGNIANPPFPVNDEFLGRHPPFGPQRFRSPAPDPHPSPAPPGTPASERSHRRSIPMGYSAPGVSPENRLPKSIDSSLPKSITFVCPWRRFSLLLPANRSTLISEGVPGGLANRESFFVAAHRLRSARAATIAGPRTALIRSRSLGATFGVALFLNSSPPDLSRPPKRGDPLLARCWQKGESLLQAAGG